MRFEPYTFFNLRVSDFGLGNTRIHETQTPLDTGTSYHNICIITYS